MSLNGHDAEIRQHYERLVLIQLVLKLNIMMAKALHPRNSAPLDTIHVGAAVYEGHMTGHPYTAHKLAQYLEMPRSTVQDRLKFLLKRKVVRQDGKLFFIGARYLQTSMLDIEQLKEIVFEATQKLQAIGAQPRSSRRRDVKR